MCDVSVDVHGGGDAVLGDVFVVVWVRLTVNRVDAGDGNSLLAQGYVTVNGGDTHRLEAAAVAPGQEERE